MHKIGDKQLSYALDVVKKERPECVSDSLYYL